MCCIVHQRTLCYGLLDQAGVCGADVRVDLGVVVVCGAVLLLDVLSTGREEGERVKVFMGWLLSAGHQLPVVEQL